MVTEMQMGIQPGTAKTQANTLTQATAETQKETTTQAQAETAPQASTEILPASAPQAATETLPASAAQASTETQAETTTQAVTSRAPATKETAPDISLDEALSHTAHEALRMADKSDTPQVGLGVDVVDISRMERIIKRSPAFTARVFSEAERSYCNNNALASAHYAARFAAKEAVVKALGTGFSDGIVVRDVEIVHTAHGRPVVVLHGRAKEIADERHICEIPVSLSFTHSHAVACAVCITEDVRDARAKKEVHLTSRQQLNEQFKHARRMLDDL